MPAVYDRDNGGTNLVAVPIYDFPTSFVPKFSKTWCFNSITNQRYMFPTNSVSEIRGQNSRKHSALSKGTISDLNKLRETDDNLDI